MTQDELNELRLKERIERAKRGIKYNPKLKTMLLGKYDPAKRLENDTKID